MVPTPSTTSSNQSAKSNNPDHPARAQNVKTLVEQSLQALSWDRFVELASENARSIPGRARILALKNPANWSANLASARHAQTETKEALAILDRDGLWGPLQDLADPLPYFERLHKGGILEIAELAQLRAWIYAFDAWSQFPREELNAENFKKALNLIPDFSSPLRHLEKILTPQGELSERASPRLAAIYHDIRELRKQISTTLDHLLKTFQQKGVLQENFSDVRDGRYVIPIKIAAQNEVEGIIYEASASRQTVFVEPKEVAPLNNRLRQRENDLVQEIFAILTEAAKILLPFCHELTDATDVVTHWDAVHAKASFARKYGGKIIEVEDTRRFSLQRTTHPLLFWSLPAEQVIHNQIEFEDPVRTLLITGPNTGGKTVFLKTLGLAGLCARTGFTFPANGQPRVPFFQSIFADLGDAQSIEAQLSSFSGHILRFKEILEQATDQSLVLLDELNTATDPEEGAALGRAFLETLMVRGAMIVSTTHDPNLKALALNDPRILNASMAFNESARTPTYQMILGVPGRSRAIQTAERLGIPADVLALAKTFLTDNHRQFEDMLNRLQSNIEISEQARREAQHQLDEAERLKKEWTERTDKNLSEILDRTRQRLRKLVEQAQDQVRETVKKLDEGKTRREVDAVRSELNQALNDTTTRLDQAFQDEAPETAAQLEAARREKAPAPVSPHHGTLAPGTLVRVPKWKSIGTVLNHTGDKIKVSLGTLQVQLTPNDIQLLTAAEMKSHPQAKAKKSTSVQEAESAAFTEKLDLRGIRFDEAMAELGRYLDVAYRAKRFSQVTIVHGLGSGAIREGTRDMLKRLPYIKTYRDGGVGQGGTGATLVEFDY